jgi:hypothetical protein
VLVTALVAAVVAHVAIDVAGDYLLRDDTYDHLAHGSRELVTLIAGALACGAGLLLLRRLLRAAASAAQRARLRLQSRASIVRGSVAVAALALIIVPVMESIDAVRAGSTLESLADAFGGSLALGVATTLSCALLLCGMLFAAIAWLCHHPEVVAAALSALLAPQPAPPDGRFLAALHFTVVSPRAGVRALRLAKRGPPLRTIVSGR